jgi:hypothetical protein
MRKALLLSLISLLVSCSPTTSREVWYGLSDQTAFYLTYSEKGDYIVVATMSRNTLLRAMRGVVSDPKRALQELFGEKGDHFIGGDEESWVKLTTTLFDYEALAYQGVRPTSDVLLSLALKHATTLRKSGVVATLDKLPGEKSSMRDLERLLKGVEGGFKKVRLYNLDTFIPAKVEWEALTRWVSGWRESVLIEASYKE